MDNPSYFEPPKSKPKSTRSSSRLSMASSHSASSLSMTSSTSNTSSAYFSASTSSLLHPSLLEEQEEPPSLFPPPAPVKAKPTKKLTRQSVRLTAPPCVPELVRNYSCTPTLKFTMLFCGPPNSCPLALWPSGPLALWPSGPLAL